MTRLISLVPRAPLGAGLVAALGAALLPISVPAQLPARPAPADVAARVDSIIRPRVGDGGTALKPDHAVARPRGPERVERRR